MKTSLMVIGPARRLIHLEIQCITAIKQIEDKWTVITAKCRRKGFLSKNLTEANNTYPLSTANRYEQLTNLQDTQANDITLKIQEENKASNIPNHNHQTKLLH